MKTITKFCLLFLVAFCLNVNAQQTAHSHKAGPLSEDNVTNSKKEIKREKRVREASVSTAKSNEHSARKKHKLGTRLFHKPGKKKMHTEKVAKS